MGNSSRHVPFVSPHLFRSSFNIILFADSTWPFVCGCPTDENFCWMPKSLQNCWTTWLANCVPLSEIITTGTPNLHTCFFQWKPFTFCHPYCGESFCFNPLRKIINCHQNKLWLSPRRWKKSHKVNPPHMAKGQGVVMDERVSGGALCRSANIWHLTHFLTYSLQSVLKVGQ